MPTVQDVRVVMKQGDRKQAAEMLRDVLKRNPDADALYLAALLAKDDETAIKHLRRALLLDPRHEASRKWLERKDIDPGTFVQNLGGEVIQTIYEQSDRTPLLRRLGRWQQLAIFGVLASVIVFAIGLALVVLVRSAPEAQAGSESGLPTPIPVTIVNADALRDQLINSDLELSVVPRSSAVRNIQGDILSFSLTVGSRLHDVNILVYRDISALIADQNTINSYASYASIKSMSNVVMIYPNTLDSQTARRLIEAFEAAMRA